MRPRAPYRVSSHVPRVCAGSFLVEWAVEYHDAGCDDGGSSLQAQGILSLRAGRRARAWTKPLVPADSRRSGQLITRTDMVANADALAADGRAPQPPLGGYLRTSSKYTLNEDGTRLKFEFVDQQKYKLPPNYQNGATLGPSLFCIPKVEGKFSIMTDENAKFYAEVRIHMEGVPYMNTQDMIEIAASIAMSKIQGAGPADINSKTPDVFSATGTVSEGIWDNTIDFAMKAMINNSGKERFEAFAVSPKVFGQDEAYAKTASRSTAGIVPDIDPAFLTLVANAFQDPCVATSILSTAMASLSSQQVSQLQQVADLGSPPDRVSCFDLQRRCRRSDFSFSWSPTQAPDETIDNDSLINDPASGVWENLMIEIDLHAQRMASCSCRRCRSGAAGGDRATGGPDGENELCLDRHENERHADDSTLRFGQIRTSCRRER